MAYDKTMWDENTDITPEKLQNIEDGIEDAHNTLDSHLAEYTKYHDTAGTANALTVSIGTGLTFDLTKDGNLLHINPSLTNTGAATINPDGQGVKSIKKFDVDTDAYIDLEEGDIKKNQQTALRWDLTNGFFVLAPKGGAKKLNITIGSGDFDGIDEKFIYKTDTGGIMQKFDHAGNLIFNKNLALGSSWVGGSYSKKGCIFAEKGTLNSKLYDENGTLLQDRGLTFALIDSSNTKPGFNGERIIFQNHTTACRLISKEGTVLMTLGSLQSADIQFFINFRGTMVTRAFTHSFPGYTTINRAKLFIRKDDVVINQLVEDGSMITCLKAFYI